MKDWQKKSVLGLGAALGAFTLPRYFWFRKRSLPEGTHWTTRALAGGQDIAIAHLANGHANLCVLAHGFLRCSEDAGMVALVKKLAPHYDVLSFDFPGHGRSEGSNRLSFLEAADCLRQVLDYAQELNYEHVAVLGYSMGAAAGILTAAKWPLIDALVSVSCPAAPPNNQSTQKHWSTWPWRWWARLMGTQVAESLKLDVWPIERIEEVGPIPILIVHHSLDTLVSEQEARTLYQLAPQPKDYLQVSRALHAYPPASVDPIIAWLKQRLEK